jgi:hypothetical protein
MTSPFSAEALFGATPVSPSMGTAAPTQVMGVDASDGGAGWLISPHNPLVWFGLFLLATVGAAGVAGSVRLGPAKIGGSVGKA